MKPLQKVVTASDIQNCLYYVHVASADDEMFQEGLQDEQHQRDRIEGDETGISQGSINDFHKKPLQQEPDSYINERPELPSRTQPHSQPPTKNLNSMQVRRKPVGRNSTLKTAIMDSPSGHSPTLLGPRPMHRHAYSEHKEALDIRPERRNVDMRRRSEYSTKPPQPPPRPNGEHLEQQPYLPPRPLTRALEDRVVVEGQRMSHRRESVETKSPQVNNIDHSQHEWDVSLTLIRRHDNLQQNVGKISRTSRSARLDRPTSTDYGRLEEDGTLIEILTPGYAKFTGEDSIDHKKPSNPNDFQSRFTQNPLSYNGEHTCFNRQLQASNNKKSLDQRRKLNSSDSTSGKHGFSSKFKFHRHGQDTMSDEKAGRSQQTPTQESIDSKGYMFQSPWNGICEFHTGIAGRSLKCKHTIPPPNPISKSQPRSTPVSELRFNLPSSQTLAASPRRSNFPHSHIESSKPSTSTSTQNHHRLSSHDAVSDQGYEFRSSDDRLDLSLGRERAGGGFGGKQAKLGKLIVENEGLKMLDLVVAANVGVWWRVYERLV